MSRECIKLGGSRRKTNLGIGGRLKGSGGPIRRRRRRKRKWIMLILPGNSSSKTRKLWGELVKGLKEMRKGTTPSQPRKKKSWVPQFLRIIITHRKTEVNKDNKGQVQESEGKTTLSITTDRMWGKRNLNLHNRIWWMLLWIQTIIKKQFQSGA